MKTYTSLDEIPTDCQELVRVGDMFYNITNATDAELDQYGLRVEISEEEQKRTLLQYLKDTDWYIIREMDSGIPIPQEIKLFRQEARDKL
jgi:hypothetical protein